ncbi:hypothetical protein [Aquimarina sp. AU119]|uniref:hypothetical protein n=1 Tax=Aquimarina sp. AU119 TaxID=2108528 RepID=UPI000D69C2F7|nr:hypothetical protein [Aquimarina sp. AU119]
MRNKLLTILFLIPILVLSQANLNEEAINYYKSNIKIVESLNKGYEVGKEYDLAIDFFEELTKVKSYHQYGFADQPEKYATKYVIKDWKKWLDLNLDIIYWDKKTNAIKATSKVKYLEKDPKKVFLENYDILKANTFGKHIDDTEFNHSIDFFIELIPFCNFLNNLSPLIEIENDKVNIYKKTTKSHFKKLREWYKLNKEKLIWNKMTQSVKIKK